MDTLSTYIRPVEDVNHPNRVNTKLWRVAAATTATSSQFEPQLLSQYAENLGLWHPDRSLGDPIEHVAKEVKAEFPDREALIINIGSGVNDRRWTDDPSANSFIKDNPKVVKEEIIINHIQLLGRYPAHKFGSWKEINEKVTGFMGSDDTFNQKIVAYARKLSEACPPEIPVQST